MKTTQILNTLKSAARIEDAESDAIDQWVIINKMFETN